VNPNDIKGDYDEKIPHDGNNIILNQLNDENSKVT
jgi:hypothetical protein